MIEDSTEVERAERKMLGIILIVGSVVALTGAALLWVHLLGDRQGGLQGPSREPPGVRDR